MAKDGDHSVGTGAGAAEDRQPGSPSGAGPEVLAGRYVLGETLGSGGMGRVWQAEDTVLGRQVAVKELRVAQALDADQLATLHHRMKQEARAAARVNHPGVVTVHDVFEHDGRPWIVMELVDGRSLADVIDEEGTLLPRDAASVGVKVLEALRAAHDAGVLHRDVKPGNVLLARDGRVLLTDFGIATFDGGTSLTKTGDLVGSPDYLAPERAMGRRPGPESDLWSLGATLYAAVEGQSPFRRTSALSTLQAVVMEEAPPPRNAGPLAPVLEALLRKDPHQRPSHDETARMLQEVAEGRAVAEDAGPGRQYVPTQPVSQPFPGVSPAVPPRYPNPSAVSPAPADSLAGATLPGPYPPYPALPQTGGNGGLWRRPWLLVAAAALVAAVAGGGVALATLGDGKPGKPSAGDRPAASQTVREPGKNDDKPQGEPSNPVASPTKNTASTPVAPPTKETASGSQSAAQAPPGYRMVNDPAGFSMAVPEGWIRQVNNGQIDYTPDNGRHLLRIGTIPSATSSVYDHFLELEGTVGKYTDYRRVRLDENAFRGRPGAIWEFTWTSVQDHPGPRHGIDQGYIADNGTEYDLYAASPEEDWGTVMRHFQTMLDTWRLNP